MAIHIIFWFTRTAGTSRYEDGNHAFKENNGSLFVNVFKRDHYEAQITKMFKTNIARCPTKIFQFFIIKPPVN